MPPLVWRVWIMLAGWVVPSGDRAEWRAQWRSAVASWRVLRDRGELPGRDQWLIGTRLMQDAFGARFTNVRARRLVRGPAVLIAGAAAALALIAMASGGFRTTWWLIGTARDLQLRPMPGIRYDARGDFVFKYGAPMVTAFAVSAALLVVKRRSLRSIGWRSWTLLLFKVGAVALIASLLWVEGGHGLRSYFSREGVRFGVFGVGLGILYIVAVGYATAWSVADQRRRCPVCLHRLTMPVTIGSWASIYNPAATELVCDQGHGSLALQEAESGTGSPDRWTVLDSTWRELFR
jgi:hypothetical protein